jgi:hypothetical protein
VSLRGEFAVKRKILLVLSLIAALFVVSSCSSENTQTSEGKVVTQTNNVVVNTSALQLQTPTALAINIVEPYTFELSGFGENYIVTAASENAGAQIRFSVEDNKYNSTDYLMNAPDGYFAGTLSKVNCFVIKAPKNNPNVPDLLQVNFEPLEQNTNKKQVAAFYSVKSSELLPVRVYTTIPYNLAELQFCEDTVLIRTEDYKFMPPPTVTWNAEGTPSVSIYTYTFDTTRMTLTKAAEAVSADNQLYFSYSALALAGDVASMFTTKTLAVSSDKEFVSITNAETGDSEHYFLVSDPRFSTSEELVAFANQYFAPEITAELYKNAPQKYRDINGQLYTLRLNTVAAVKTPVIADILEEDTDLSVQITGGGSVVIRKDGENFKIMKYTLV